MRPYRGKTKDGKWVKGGLYEINNRSFILQEYDIRQPSLFYGFNYPQENFSICLIEVIPETVGQFVCKDKNSKDVFAGDKARRKEPDPILAESFGGEQDVDAIMKGGFLFWDVDVDGATFCPADEVGDIELIEEKE